MTVIGQKPTQQQQKTQQKPASTPDKKPPAAKKPPKEIHKVDYSELPDPASTPLLLKLVAVRKHIGGFEKDSAAEQFTYVSGAQVLAKVLDSMNYLGLLLIPKFVHGVETHESRTFERTNKWGTKMITDHIIKTHVNMTWVDAHSKEEYVVPWLFYGEQENDVAQTFGSGLTYMERYFLMKFFNQPTDWLDPDAKKEPHGDETLGGGKKETAALSDEEKAAIEAQERDEAERESTAKEFIDQTQVNALTDMLRNKRIPQTAVFQKYGVDSLSDLTKGDYYRVVKDIEVTPAPHKKTAETNKALEGIE